MNERQKRAMVHAAAAAGVGLFFPLFASLIQAGRLGLARSLDSGASSDVDFYKRKVSNNRLGPATQEQRADSDIVCARSRT